MRGSLFCIDGKWKPMDIKQRKLVKRELLKLQLQEKKLVEAALNAKTIPWKAQLEEKIPDKVYDGLESAFCKGFSLVFRQGRAIIEKTYNKEALQKDHARRDQEIQTRGSRRDFKQMNKSARRSDGRNMAATTAEGVALGFMGVGLPDIVLFLSTLLKGIYETAIHYGFAYESPSEQYLILKMMSASLKTGKAWVRENAAVDRLLEEDAIAVSGEVLEDRIRRTASDFAVDMLLLKFIQGLPVVGVLGGAANPVYYRKVMKYVQMKYRKRYLLKQIKHTGREEKR